MVVGGGKAPPIPLAQIQEAITAALAAALVSHQALAAALVSHQTSRDITNNILISLQAFHTSITKQREQVEQDLNSVEAELTMQTDYQSQFEHDVLNRVTDRICIFGVEIRPDLETRTLDDFTGMPDGDACEQFKQNLLVDITKYIVIEMPAIIQGNYDLKNDDMVRLAVSKFAGRAVSWWQAGHHPPARPRWKWRSF